LNVDERAGGRAGVVSPVLPSDASATFRIPPWLRRSVYFVRMGAGRRAELIQATTGIALVCW